MSKCELCELREYTRHYCRFTYPFRFAVVECDSCSTPMAVLGEHRAAATNPERAFMTAALTLVARECYGDAGFIVDSVMRQIPDHCHIHARPLIGRSRSGPGA